MRCEAKGLDYLPLWFLYSIVVMNILLVNSHFLFFLSTRIITPKLSSTSPSKVLNASSNFLIYLFAGNSFRDQFRRIVGVQPDTSILTTNHSTICCVFCLNIANNPIFKRWHKIF